MPEQIELSKPRRQILDRIVAQGKRGDELVLRARVILLAADGKSAAQIGFRLRLIATEIQELLLAWQNAEMALSSNESAGERALTAYIRSLLAKPKETTAGDFCCGCDDDDDEAETLGPQEIKELACKIYDLLRYELIVERQRMGYRRLV